MREQEGIKRSLTLGETHLAHSVYGNLIFYGSVSIHCESYLPFDLQRSRVAMTPNGELYFRLELYRSDYSNVPPDLQHLFIHEMTHVWQHQKGMWVRAIGACSVGPSTTSTGLIEFV